MQLTIIILIYNYLQKKQKKYDSWWGKGVRYAPWRSGRRTPCQSWKADFRYGRKKAEIERTIKTKKFFPMVHLSVYAFKQRLRKARRLLQQYSDSSYPHPYTFGCNHSGRLPVPQTRFVSVTTDGNHSCCQMVHLPPLSNWLHLSNISSWRYLSLNSRHGSTLFSQKLDISRANGLFSCRYRSKTSIFLLKGGLDTIISQQSGS